MSYEQLKPLKGATIAKKVGGHNQDLCLREHGLPLHLLHPDGRHHNSQTLDLLEKS